MPTLLRELTKERILRPKSEDARQQIDEAFAQTAKFRSIGEAAIQAGNSESIIRTGPLFGPELGRCGAPWSGAQE